MDPGSVSGMIYRPKGRYQFTVGLALNQLKTI